MIARIIDFCGRNRLLVFMGTLLVVVWAGWSIKHTPIDALPDISDTQVIIFTEWPGRSPTIIEDQITYPLVTSFIAAPKVKTVRGFTMFGMSFVFILFEDGTDIYWARSRVIEYLSKLQGQLPEGVTPFIGPDATGVGWVYEYALVDTTGKRNLQELRTFQDWYLRYWLESVPGVAEVASVGGYVKEYQVEIDPVKLQSYRLSLSEIKNAIRQSNNDVGGRVIELAEHEYAVRGRGYITDKQMLEQVVVGTDAQGTPILIKDIARVQIGGNMRRGFAELNGEGEAVGGIVVMRYGKNALTVIDRVKKKLQEMKPFFPAGVTVVPTYDRSELIKHSMNTLSVAVIEEIVLVSLIIILFLFHWWSALVSIIALLLAVLFSFIPLYYLGLTTNIMSLVGIIIAIGDVVDAAMVMTENAHRALDPSIHPPTLAASADTQDERKLQRATRAASADTQDERKLQRATRAASADTQDGRQLQLSRVDVIIQAAREIGPSVFSSLLVTVVAFIPVFTLQAQEGRLFAPLAFTKTFAVFFGALLGITVVPALMVVFIRGTIRPALKNPINRLLVMAYRPLIRFCLRFRYVVVGLFIILAGVTVPIFFKLGSEFMPPLDEESIFFMPITVPGMSIEAAKKLVQTQNKIIKSFPEVKSVFGKGGRAQTPTDPAPLSMVETVINLHPPSAWRPGMTKEKLVKEMEQALNFPGVQNAFTMPIKARIDMLTTGIRTPVGIKVFGDDLKKIDAINQELEAIIRKVPGTRSVYAEREMGGFFIDFIPDRRAIARYGLRVEDVFDMVETAIGGLDIAATIEGRERYRINVRYPRELRDDIEKLKNVLVPIPILKKSTLYERVPYERAAYERTSVSSEHGNGEQNKDMNRVAQVPLGMLGTMSATMGAPMIKDENGSLTGWVYIDTSDSDIGGYVQRAKQAVAQHLKLPERYYIKWTGQYEYLERMRELMKFTIPLTLLLILLILFFNFRGIAQTLIVMLSTPFAAIGAIWLLFVLRYNTSVAVWVGMIALLGIAAQTASLMMVYLEEGYRLWKTQNRMNSRADLMNMVVEHGSLRLRPLLMAVSLNMVGLVPIMMSSGVGADVAKRISAPLWGGLVTLTILTLLVIPVVYVLWRGREQSLKLL